MLLLWSWLALQRIHTKNEFLLFSRTQKDAYVQIVHTLTPCSFVRDLTACYMFCGVCSWMPTQTKQQPSVLSTENKKHTHIDCSIHYMLHNLSNVFSVLLALSLFTTARDFSVCFIVVVFLLLFLVFGRSLSGNCIFGTTDFSYCFFFFSLSLQKRNKISASIHVWFGALCKVFFDSVLITIVRSKLISGKIQCVVGQRANLFHCALVFFLFMWSEYVIFRCRSPDHQMPLSSIFTAHNVLLLLDRLMHGSSTL